MAADSMLATWRCTPLAEEPAHVGAPLPSWISGVVDDSTDLAGTRVVRRALELDQSLSLHLDALALRLGELGHRELFRELWLNPGGAGDSVYFRPVMRRLPRRLAGIGVAFDGELGGRAWGGVVDRRLPALGVEAAVVFAVGQYRSDLSLSARRPTLLGQRSFTPVATMLLGGEDIRRFDTDGGELRADDLSELVAHGGAERHVGQTVRVTLGAEVRWWNERHLLDREPRTRLSVGPRLLAEKLTGSRERLARLELIWSSEYSRASFDARFRGAFGGVRFEQQARIGVGTRLPAHRTVALGGHDGFPGLHLGERRGDREVFASLAASHRVAGPLRLRVTVATGRTAFGNVASTVLPRDEQAFGSGPLFGGEGWINGVRAGVASDTPLGPVRVEYGWNDAGRDALYLRLGRWF